MHNSAARRRGIRELKNRIDRTPGAKLADQIDLYIGEYDVARRAVRRDKLRLDARQHCQEHGSYRDATRYSGCQHSLRHCPSPFAHRAPAYCTVECPHLCTSQYAGSLIVDPTPGGGGAGAMHVPPAQSELLLQT